MTAPRIAARYAEALFELARSRRAVDALGSELAALAGAVESTPELQGTLCHPGPAREAKIAAVQAALGERFSPEVVALVAALVRHGRGDAVSQVARSYRELADRALGVVRAEAATAVPISGEQRRRLVAALERMTGRRVRLEERVEPELLAGVRLMVGDRLIDGSAAGRLARMRDGLIDRATVKRLED